MTDDILQTASKPTNYKSLSSQGIYSYLIDVDTFAFELFMLSLIAANACRLVDCVYDVSRQEIWGQDCKQKIAVWCGILISNIEDKSCIGISLKQRNGDSNFDAGRHFEILCMYIQKLILTVCSWAQLVHATFCKTKPNLAKPQ